MATVNCQAFRQAAVVQNSLHYTSYKHLVQSFSLWIDFLEFHIEFHILEIQSKALVYFFTWPCVEKYTKAEGL